VKASVALSKRLAESSGSGFWGSGFWMLAALALGHQQLVVNWSADLPGGFSVCRCSKNEQNQRMQ